MHVGESVVHLPFTQSYPAMQLPTLNVGSTEQLSPPFALAMHVPFGIASVASHAESASQAANFSVAASTTPHASPSFATAAFLHVWLIGLQIRPAGPLHSPLPDPQAPPSAIGAPHVPPLHERLTSQGFMSVQGSPFFA